MTETGAIVHNEYVSDDPRKTSEFFAKMFGWTFSPMGDDYHLFEGPAGTSGGVGKPEKGESVGARSYVRVAKLGDAVRKAESLGAKVLVPHQEVPGMGTMALVVVPGGIVQGLWEPAPPSR